jgi:pimeloyl-ACP methyl ester carboxylesterase
VLLDRSSRVADFNRRVFEEIFDSPLAIEDINDTLQTKSLLVWGDSDKILDCSGIKGFQQKLLRPQTILMPEVGHLPMIEKPRTVAVDFLNFYAGKN